VDGCAVYEGGALSSWLVGEAAGWTWSAGLAGRGRRRRVWGGRRGTPADARLGNAGDADARRARWRWTPKMRAARGRRC